MVSVDEVVEEVWLNFVHQVEGDSAHIEDKHRHTTILAR
jgi:hypothetical protein